MRRASGGIAEQGVGVGFQQRTGVFVAGIVDGTAHGGTSWPVAPMRALLVGPAGHADSSVDFAAGTVARLP
ncbi:hypothetical protein CLJ1_3060 [Pseudomonas paraeruginosa]|nr:hypothetical protein CLJ1_3060 [Pseudomonas aeruginosa]